MSEENTSEENKSNFEKAKDNIGDAAGNIGDEFKETAGEFKEGWNDMTHHGENKKMLAGILAILIGFLGIHKFVLGYTKEGVIQILLSFLCGLGGLIALIEGIIYLTKSDEEFYNTYQVGKKPWF